MTEADFIVLLLCVEFNIYAIINYSLIELLMLKSTQACYTELL